MWTVLRSRLPIVSCGACFAGYCTMVSIYNPPTSIKGPQESRRQYPTPCHGVGSESRRSKRSTPPLSSLSILPRLHLHPNASRLRSWVMAVGHRLHGVLYIGSVAVNGLCRYHCSLQPPGTSLLVAQFPQDIFERCNKYTENNDAIQDPAANTRASSSDFSIDHVHPALHFITIQSTNAERVPAVAFLRWQRKRESTTGYSISNRHFRCT